MTCTNCKKSEAVEVIYKLPKSGKILVAVCSECSILHWDYMTGRKN